LGGGQQRAENKNEEKGLLKGGIPNKEAGGGEGKSSTLEERTSKECRVSDECG